MRNKFKLRNNSKIGQCSTTSQFSYENVLDYEVYQKVVNLKEAKDSTADKGQSLDPRILTYWPLKPKPA